MRKLLLATVAVLGASIGVASVADAQTASPAPGTVTVRLNGRFRFYAFEANDGETDNNLAGSATGLTAQGGYNKVGKYGFAEYARLFPGFDGVAANGLKYGASLEIRQDQSSGAGGGAYGSISQQDRARGGLYLRREWGYLGTDQLGTVRFGATDQPTSLYATGTFENFDAGGWNGDIPSFLNGAAIVPFPFEDVGSYYTTDKAVYLSPQLLGFDLGVSFEPSTSNVTGDGTNGCGAGGPLGTNFVNQAGNFTTAAGANSTGVSGPGCNYLTSSPVNSESARRRNTLDALLRYRGSFGGFGIAATGAIIRGSHVLDNSGVAFNNNIINGALRPNYDGLDAGDFGLAITYAGFTVGGHYTFGRFAPGFSTLVPKGLVGSEAWLGGASYTIGPIVVGASYFVSTSAGDAGNAYFGRQRREAGAAYGGTYSLAPGVSLFLSGLWGTRRQDGFNFVTGQGVTAAAPRGNPNNNQIRSSIISVGTSFTW